MKTRDNMWKAPGGVSRHLTDPDVHADVAQLLGVLSIHPFSCVFSPSRVCLGGRELPHPRSGPSSGDPYPKTGIARPSHSGPTL